MISTAYSPTSFNGDGVTTAFPITWNITASGDVVVTEVIIATGVETVKTLTTHYTVTGTGPFTVTAVTAPAASVRWVISRAVARTQTVDYVAFDPFPAETHEASLDKLTLLAQDYDGKVNRTLRQPDGDSATIDYLPPKITRASQYLGFDADGDPIALAAPTGTTGVSTFAATVLDDTTAIAVLNTLGLSAAAWTPTITAATVGNLSVAYSIQYGWYVKIHGLIILSFSVQFTPTYTTATGALRIGGVPFTNLGQPTPAGPLQVQGNVDAGVSNFSLSMPGGGVTYLVAYQQTSSGIASVDITDFATTTSGNVLSGTLIYLTTA
jgi:hypothetical protein